MLFIIFTGKNYLFLKVIFLSCEDYFFTKISLHSLVEHIFLLNTELTWKTLYLRSEKELVLNQENIGLNTDNPIFSGLK